MNLYILRHAIAEVRSPRWPDDTERPLTSSGEKKMFKVAEGMRHLKLDFDVILSSPYQRARRTAEIVCEVLGEKRQLSEYLKSDSDPKLLIQELNSRYQSRENILLVGHEPDLSQLVSLLCCGTTDLSLTLKKGGLCKLSVSKLKAQKCASLEWVLTPGQLRKFRKKK